MMPWRLAYWPVTIEARFGEQIGDLPLLLIEPFDQPAQIEEKLACIAKLF